MKVFLSYAPEDRDFAQAVAGDLREAGHDVYPDENWPQDVGAAIDQADAFVVLLSPASTGSPFVTQEIKLALVAERLANRLIPVLLKPTAQIPWILNTMQPISATARRTRIGKAVVERLKEPVDSTAR